MSATDQNKIVPNKVLVTGASGLLGVAAIEKFLAAGWKVVGISRRKPELPSGRKIDFLSVDLRDEEKTRAAFEPLTDITHIAYTALHEKPELVAGWSSKEQIDTNNDELKPTSYVIPKNQGIYDTDTDSKGRTDLYIWSEGKIGIFDPRTIEYAEYKTPTPMAGPRRGQIDGQDRLWAGEFYAGQVMMFARGPVWVVLAAAPNR